VGGVKEIMGEILTVKEAAKYLKINVATLYKLAREGSLPSQKVSIKWRFSKEALDSWVAGKDVKLKRSKKG